MKILHIDLSILLLLFIASARGDVPDTRGPVRNAGMRVVANAEGVQAPEYTCGNPRPCRRGLRNGLAHLRLRDRWPVACAMS